MLKNNDWKSNTYKNLSDKFKALIRRIFITLNSYINMNENRWTTFPTQKARNRTNYTHNPRSARKQIIKITSEIIDVRTERQ